MLEESIGIESIDDDTISDSDPLLLELIVQELKERLEKQELLTEEPMRIVKNQYT